MKNKKLLIGLACVLLCIVLLLALCGREKDGTEQPTQPVDTAETIAPTQKVTEASTVEPTEAPTEEPTEAPTEEPTEAPTEPEETTQPTQAPASGNPNPGGTGGFTGSTVVGGNTGNDSEEDSDTKPTEPTEPTVEEPGTKTNAYTESVGELPAVISSVVIPADGSVYYHLYNADGLVLTIADENAYVVSGEDTLKAAEGIVTVPLAASEGEPVVIQIGNSGTEAKAFELMINEPLGSEGNPEVLEALDQIQTVLTADNAEGYFYTWTAEEDGTLTITVEAVEPETAAYNVILTNGETTAALVEPSGEEDQNDTEDSETPSEPDQGDSSAEDTDESQNSEDTPTTVETEEPESPAVSMEVKAGDVVTIQVVTIPAGAEAKISLNGSFQSSVGSAENPIMIPDASVPVEAPVKAGQTVHYAGYVAEMTMTIENAAGCTVTYGENTYTADENGIITVQFPAAAGMGRPMPETFAISNGDSEDAAYILNFAYPVGHMNNPAAAEEGSNTASLDAGNASGRWFTWTAADNGTVDFAIDTATTTVGWQYSINNVTQGTYGDIRWSDSDPLVSAETLTVKAGDELQINVNTYDPENPQSAPAGDVVFTLFFTGETGSESNPIWIQDTSVPMDVTVPAGKTVYVTGYIYDLVMDIENAKGLTVKLGDQEYAPNADAVVTIQTPAATGMGRPMPLVFSITNAAETDTVCKLNFTYPLGSAENPAELIIGQNEASITEGDSDGYMYTWTSYDSGLLTITMDANAQWSYVINNITSGQYGDQQWSDSNGNSQTVKVNAEDVLQIMVTTYDPANPFAAPAGTVKFLASFMAGEGTEASPYMLLDTECDITVPGATMTYYQGYFSGMILTFENAANAEVTVNGTVYQPDANGKIVVELPAATGMGRPSPVAFALSNKGEQETTCKLTATYPVGTMDNPAKLKMGENKAELEAKAQSYFYQWVAEADGTLTLNFAADTGWFYVVNNLTAGVYGDNQWSNSDPVVNPATVEVAEGDEIQITVNTFNPSDEWNTPAGTVTIQAAFAEKQSENPEQPGNPEQPENPETPETPEDQEPEGGETAELGSESNPYLLKEGEITKLTIPAGGKVYVKADASASNTNLTVNGNRTYFDWYVEMNGGQYGPFASGARIIELAVGSAYVLPIVNNDTENPAVLDVTAEAVKVGTMENPDILKDSVLDKKLSLEFEAVDEAEGYVYHWTAAEDGTLTIEIDTEKSKDGWQYFIGNFTTSVYSNTRYSEYEEPKEGEEPEPIVPVASIEMKAGQEAEIWVSTYDLEKPFGAPAGEVFFKITFEPAVEALSEEEPEEETETESSEEPQPETEEEVSEDEEETVVTPAEPDAEVEETPAEDLEEPVQTESTAEENVTSPEPVQDTEPENTQDTEQEPAQEPAVEPVQSSEEDTEAAEQVTPPAEEPVQSPVSTEETKEETPVTQPEEPAADPEPVTVDEPAAEETESEEET